MTAWDSPPLNRRQPWLKLLRLHRRHHDRQLHDPDTTTGAAPVRLPGTAYTGPVSYLQMQFVSPTQDSVNINVNINSHVPNASS